VKRGRGSQKKEYVLFWGGEKEGNPKGISRPGRVSAKRCLRAREEERSISHEKKGHGTIPGQGGKRALSGAGTDHLRFERRPTCRGRKKWQVRRDLSFLIQKKRKKMVGIKKCSS